MNIRKLIGDKKFYISVLAIALPIMLQNGITNLVNFLDNLMVGTMGTEAVSAVGIINQLVFVFNLFIFGAVSGAGIFTAQYFGKNDVEGIRYTFRFKLIICAVLTILTVFAFCFFAEPLIKLFLNDGSAEGNLDLTLQYAKQYIQMVLIGLVPYAFCQCYSDTLRQTKHTLVPMISGAVAVIVNFVLNYLLIFGFSDIPAMGVRGAAIATVTARFVECAIVVGYTHVKHKKHSFIVGAYTKFSLPFNKFIEIGKKSLPLFLNEALWSLGMTMLIRCYSVRGISVFAGFNIASTMQNVFNISFLSLGNAVGIIVGYYLGAGEFEKAKDYDNKMIAFSVFVSVIFGAIMFAVSPLLEIIYPKVGKDTIAIAKYCIGVMSLSMPVQAFLHSVYFTLRSGGKTVITFVFDSAFVWAVSVPLAFVLVTFTSLSIFIIYPLILSVDLIKCMVGYILVRKDVWINNIADNTKKQTVEI
ncbi:MAG: MATE family efflux transporter [Clostridia bacterium]|nr:MATE family efflux transporter [Clostridia bacterium]